LGIPEDLNYGLVLNYPNIICQYSALWLGLIVLKFYANYQNQ